MVQSSVRQGNTIGENDKRLVYDGMEKDLIFPQFCQRKGELKIQSFKVLDVFSVIKYLTDRFDYKETSFIREGDTAYDLKSKCR
jgi:hypothetical protein